MAVVASAGRVPPRPRAAHARLDGLDPAWNVDERHAFIADKCHLTDDMYDCVWLLSKKQGRQCYMRCRASHRRASPQQPFAQEFRLSVTRGH